MLPFVIINYVISAPSITLKDNALSLIGFFPDCLLYVYLGSTLENIISITSNNAWKDNIGTLVSMIIGLILSVIAFIWIWI